MARPLRTQKTRFGVVLDAPDAREPAHVYQRLLGWTIFNESDGWVDLAPSEDAGHNFSLSTGKDYARPVSPTVDGEPQMSLHSDIEVGDLEQATARGRRGRRAAGAPATGDRPGDARLSGTPVLPLHRLTEQQGDLGEQP